MKKSTFILICLAIILGSHCWSLAGNRTSSNNKLWHNIERTVRYQPEGEDFVITNGTRRFNRALYGSNTGFRVEAGDLPEFALYMPGMGGNLKFGLLSKNSDTWLIDADSIEAHYRAGSMIYEIQDSLLGSGKLTLTVLPLFEGEGVITRFEFTNIPQGIELTWAFGGATGKRFNRDGDIGADPESVFYLQPEYCKDNVYELLEDSFTLHYGSGRVLTEAEIYENNYKPTQEEINSTKIKFKNRLVGTPPANSVFHVADACRQSRPGVLFDSEKSDTPVITGKRSISGSEPIFILISNPENVTAPAYSELHKIFAEAETARQRQTSKVRLETPDPHLNTLGSALSMAADAIWEAPTYLHGAIAWRMRLVGWRGAYTADALGWHDLAKMHFKAYNNSQYTSPPSGPAAPDPEKHLARQKEEVGKAMYTSGYISRNPNEISTPHHYDMNLVYIDQLLRHFNYTGDLEFLAEMWPVIERHLAWEKRTFDPDNNGLYDAYASIWASDALQYSGGEVTHSSAYNYVANKMAAYLAPFINKNPEPFQKEAQRILEAINKTLWMPELGWYAEFKDLMGNRLLHKYPAVWTIYHALDSEVPDAFQAWQALRYVDTQIPHIPIQAKGLPDDGYYTLSTTNWMPYTWSINNVAFAELMHTVLAYWQAARTEQAFKLWKSTLLESMYLGASPGNFQQLSFYDAFRGELYRDFSDAVAMAARTLVEGVFGIHPRLLDGKLLIQPGFPEDWDHAFFEIQDISILFKREENTDIYLIKPSYQINLQLILKLAARTVNIEEVGVNGKNVEWKPVKNSVGRPTIEINCGKYSEYKIEVKWKGCKPEVIQVDKFIAVGDQLKINTSEGIISEIFDPQGILRNSKFEEKSLTAGIKNATGKKTAFVHLKQGKMSWWYPIEIEVRNPIEILPEKEQNTENLKFRIRNNSSNPLEGNLLVNPGKNEFSEKISIPPKAESDEFIIPSCNLKPGSNLVCVESNGKKYEKAVINWNIKNAVKIKWETVDIEKHFNDQVTNIFKPQYLSPRPSTVTLQIPIQGIGDWCSFAETAGINDSGLRQTAGAENKIMLPQGIPFTTPGMSGTNNIIFTSLWDNYPEAVTISLSGKAEHAYLLMAGSTHHMQSRFVNGVVEIEYTDGISEALELVNPETWWPIEQDYYEDGFAFHVDAPRPPRVHLKTGQTDMNGYNALSKNRTIHLEGGAATVFDLVLDSGKELKSLRLKTIANDVVIGLMAITLEKN